MGANPVRQPADGLGGERNRYEGDENFSGDGE